MIPLRNQIRIQQTQAALDQLSAEIEEWFTCYKNEQQYYTQLTTLQKTLAHALKELRRTVESVQASDTGAVYAACRKHDQHLLWVRRVWQYFAEKFDQRTNPAFKAVLSAADEIVWSCYAPVFQAAKLTRGSAPLPYIEAHYSPQAIPRFFTTVLRDESVEKSFFDAILSRLPIPIVSLPPICIQQPWWLIYLGHEVGHHVQYDLQLLDHFGGYLAATVQKEPLLAQTIDASWWQKWSSEIFADAFSIYSMGLWPLWAMSELELGDDLYMLRHKTFYPAPVVRLALLSRLVTNLKLQDSDGENGLRGLDPEAFTTGATLGELRLLVAAHLKLVEPVATAIDQYTFNGLGAFTDLCGLRLDDLCANGNIKRWANRLVKGQPVYLPANIRSPRLAISSGLAAWAQIAKLVDPAKRLVEQAKLAETLPEFIRSGREDGTRAAQSAPTAKAVEALGAQFVQSLLEATPEQLGL